VLAFPTAEHGTERCYHGITRGLIVNELLRRVDPQQRTVGAYVQQEIAGPLGVGKDVHVGTLTATDEAERAADIERFSKQSIVIQYLARLCLGPVFGSDDRLALLPRVTLDQKQRLKYSQKRGSFMFKWIISSRDKSIGDEATNQPWFRALESPSTNGMVSARGLARIAAAMAQGGELDKIRIISKEGLRRGMAEGKAALDAGMMVRTTNTNMGVTFFQGPDWDTRTHGFFGWGGYGGSMFSWHPELSLGVSYVPASLLNPIVSITGQTDPRCLRLLGAVRKCVASMDKAAGASSTSSKAKL
jgi:CubicO group peptidase (beta-lactamase class C family)